MQFLNFLIATLKNKEETEEINLIIYFIQPSVSKILSPQQNKNINGIFKFFHTYSKFGLYLTEHILI